MKKIRLWVIPAIIVLAVWPAGQESALLYGSSEHEYVGEFLAAGDLNNDGIDDLVVAAQ